MAVIREQLVMEDRFTSALNSYVNLMENSNRTTKQTQAAIRQLSQETQIYNSTLRTAEASARAQMAQSQAQEAAYRAEIEQKRLARETQKELNREMRNGSAAANGLASTIKSLAGAYIGLQGLKGILNLSDTITSTTARLNMMNDGLQTTDELNDMIFASAQRSRGAYQDTAAMVAKLGVLAGDAFDSSSQIVDFAEQINKQMVLSGTNAQGASAAMLQLTQAMSSGTLRGEELNSILEQTPMIAQTIAEYMGVTTGEMRELASDGKVTAEVVKNAMLQAADETNAAFESMPYTWSQVFTSFQNTAIQTFEPILNVVGKMAQVVANNLDIIAPAFYGAAAAALVFAGGTAIANISMATLTKTLLSSPIGWIALMIGAVVYQIFRWVQSVGGLSVAWLMVKDTVLTSVELMKYRIMEFVYAVIDWFGQMKVNVLISVQDMVNGAIDSINDLIMVANKVIGTSFDLIDHVTFGTESAIEHEAAKSARAGELSKMKAEMMANQLERDVEIQQKKAAAQKTPAGGGVGGLDYDALTGDVAAIKNNTGSLKKSVDMGKEDIKSLVDVATRQYVNKINLNSQTPIINVSGANTGNTPEDRKALADTIKDIIIEQAASASYRPTAMPV